jgi:hypothetical protein
MLSWKTKTLKSGTPHGPLLIDVEMPDAANLKVEEGLQHNHEPKNAKFSSVTAI